MNTLCLQLDHIFVLLLIVRKIMCPSQNHLSSSFSLLHLVAQSELSGCFWDNDQTNSTNSIFTEKCSK